MTHIKPIPEYDDPVVLFSYIVPNSDLKIASIAVSPYTVNYKLRVVTNVAFDKIFIRPSINESECNIQLLITPHEFGPHGDVQRTDLIQQSTIFTNIGVVTYNDVQIGIDNAVEYIPIFSYGDFQNRIEEILVDTSESPSVNYKDQNEVEMVVNILFILAK